MSQQTEHPAIEISKLSHTYGDEPDAFTLKNISFEVAQGERVGILGANGSGKTTLIRLLMKMLPSQSGHISYGGRDLHQTTQAELARNVAYVPQSRDFQYGYTVESLVSMGRYPHGGSLFYRPSPEDSQMVEEILHRMDLYRFRNRRVTSLSGGEFQRVILARALVQHTQVLLLDEPTNHLDLRHQLGLLDLIRREQAARPFSVLVIFHDINLALEFCDRLVVLDRGRIAAIGTAGEIVASGSLEKVYGLGFEPHAHPVSGKPQLLSYLSPAAHPNCSDTPED